MTKVKVEHQTKKYKTNGFEGVSYWDWTYTDDKGYFNISLPRNNRYRVSFKYQTQMIMQETTHHIHLTDIILQMLLTQELHLTSI